MSQGLPTSDLGEQQHQHLNYVHTKRGLEVRLGADFVPSRKKHTIVEIVM